MSIEPRQPIPAAYQSFLYYDQQYKVLICKKCDEPQAVHKAGLARHLWRNHSLKKKQYKPMIDAIANLPIPNTLKDLPHIPDGLPHRHALPVIEGYACDLCHFWTGGSSAIFKHIKEHRVDRRHDGIAGFRLESLQTWYGGRDYWIMAKDGSGSRGRPEEPTQYLL